MRPLRSLNFLAQSYPTGSTRTHAKLSVRHRLELPQKNYPIGEVKQAMIKARMSQKDVHDKTGIAISMVSGVESEKRNISIDRAARLAHAVGVPLHVLLKP